MLARCGSTQGGGGGSRARCTAARANDAELRQGLATAKSKVAALVAKSKVAALELELKELKKSSVTLVAPRTSSSLDAPLTARTLEHLRRICEETNCSFHGPWCIHGHRPGAGALHRGWADRGVAHLEHRHQGGVRAARQDRRGS